MIYLFYNLYKNFEYDKRSNMISRSQKLVFLRRIEYICLCYLNISTEQNSVRS